MPPPQQEEQEAAAGQKDRRHKLDTPNTKHALHGLSLRPCVCLSTIPPMSLTWPCSVPRLPVVQLALSLVKSLAVARGMDRSQIGDVETTPVGSRKGKQARA
jgi:hypothetical protein